MTSIETSTKKYAECIFKAPEISDREWVQALLAGESSFACEHNFANICLWSTAYPQMIGRVEDRVIVQMMGGPGLSHLFPMGKGPLTPSIEAVAADAQAYGVPLTLICVTDEQKKQLEEELPGKFVFYEDRDGFDYLYRVEKLAELPGKKLHAKRNHIQRFCEQFPDWSFVPIDEGNIIDCLTMEKDWFRQQEESGRVNRTMLNERKALFLALEHMDDLGLSGGIIYGNGMPVAFSLGSLTSPECYNIHFEKAYGEIQGAYAIINREVARWVRQRWPEVIYINREDDMGIEGLRKAKQSYHPDLLLKKYCVVLSE